MKMYVLEDKETEFSKAVKAISDAGHKCPDISFMEDLTFNYGKDGHEGFSVGETITAAIKVAKRDGGGIITDMMFQTSPNSKKDDPLPPGGLLVLIHALANGVPVVVCTDAAEVGGHHAKALSWIHDGYVIPAQRAGVLPFGWVEDKDWDKAVALLAQMMSGDPGE